MSVTHERLALREQLRRMTRERRLALTPDQCVVDAHSIVQKVRRLLQQTTIESLGLYWPVNNEVDMRVLLSEYPNCYLPKIVAPKTPLQFVRYTQDINMVQRSGVLQPSEEAQNFITPCDMTAVIVPLSACDAQGHRLGSGQGYYDHTFPPTTLKKPWFIGVAYDCQMLSALPNAEWDLILDAVVTPTHVFLCTSRMRDNFHVVP